MQMHVAIIKISTTKTPHTIPIIKGVWFFVFDETGVELEQLALVARHKNLFPSYLHMLLLILKYLCITNIVFSNTLYLWQHKWYYVVLNYTIRKVGSFAYLKTSPSFCWSVVGITPLKLLCDKSLEMNENENENETT